MKVFRGQAKNLRKNIKQNNLKPLLVVFGVLVMITLTYKASNGVIGVGNTMFKEGNKKGRPRQRRRQGFEGREGTSVVDPTNGGAGFEGGRKYRTGFAEGTGADTGVAEDQFTGRRVGAYEGMTSCACNAAPVHGFRGNRRQGFRGNRRQGFRGRGRRREGMDDQEVTTVIDGGHSHTDEDPEGKHVHEKEKKDPDPFTGKRFGKRR